MAAVRENIALENSESGSIGCEVLASRTMKRTIAADDRAKAAKTPVSPAPWTPASMMP
jgi:hypothetical protein